MFSVNCKTILFVLSSYNNILVSKLKGEGASEVPFLFIKKKKVTAMLTDI